jgi:hypothetical protein
MPGESAGGTGRRENRLEKIQEEKAGREQEAKKIAAKKQAEIAAHSGRIPTERRGTVNQIADFK